MPTLHAQPAQTTAAVCFAALLVFVAGFNGTFSWHHALALFLEGLILLSLWHDSSTTPADASSWSTRRPRTSASR